MTDRIRYRQTDLLREEKQKQKHKNKKQPETKQTKNLGYKISPALIKSQQDSEISEALTLWPLIQFFLL